MLTWTVALAKTIEQSASLDEACERLAGSRGTCSALARAARDELMASGTGFAKDGMKERTVWHLERLVAGAGRSLNRGTGLFGTVRTNPCRMGRSCRC